MKTQKPRGHKESGEPRKLRETQRLKEIEGISSARLKKNRRIWERQGAKSGTLWKSRISASFQALISILALAFAMVLLYIGSFIPYDSIVSRQIQAFQAAEQASRHYGYLQPQVVDGFSEEPLAGAVIVVPETGNRFVTSEDGRTAVIQVPIREDEHFAKISAKPWSEITLIVYKEGYLEYVLFHTHVWENQTRKGPKILLFPRVEGEEQEPFSVVEGPHRLWVRDLVEKYRPKD
ncbi:MAG: hypothetical protein ACOX27_04185 [Caldicoprobacterales bacterium]|jgi:hypothetical protein